MNDLVTYIRAIHRQAGPAIIVRQQSEQHSEQDEESSPQLCPECWISYRVVTSPIPITPARKLFHNPCQEAFWLKMQEITPAV
ncbi:MULTISPECIES: hypothetical protein [unclassified Aeromonas]|uniref:hypothetical protein n=1 Tax=unclassified Aeromonas TaxID=257493 RepID=UPI003526CB45